MTSLQLSVLWRCAQDDPALPGMSALFGQQAGRTRQLNWLFKRKMIRKHGGRWVATRYGRRILDFHKWLKTA